MLTVEASMNRQSWTRKWAPTITTKNAGGEAVFDQVRFEELAERYSIDQAAGGNLEAYLNGMLAADISHEVICGYVIHRFRQGAGVDRVNSELLALKRMFDRAMATVPPRSFHAPRIPVLTEVEAMRRAWLKSSNDEGGT
jgi:hypothetical protein